MRMIKRGAFVLLTLLFTLTFSYAQSEAEVTLDFKNAEVAETLIRNYTAALQSGDVNKMNAQLHKDAMIYGLGGGADSLNVKQHKDYFTNSTNQYTHAISEDLYLPVKVENNWNEGEWLLAWGTNTVTNKKSGIKVEVPYHTVSLVENGKIIFIRYFYDMMNLMTSQGYTVTPPK